MSAIITTVDEEDSDDDEHAITSQLQSFTASLDAMTKTLEDDTRHFQERLLRRQQQLQQCETKKTMNDTSRQTFSAVDSRPRLDAITTPLHGDSIKYNGRNNSFMYRTPPVSVAPAPKHTIHPLVDAVDDEIPTPMRTPVPLMFSPQCDLPTRLKAPKSDHLLPDRSNESQSNVCMDDVNIQHPKTRISTPTLVGDIPTHKENQSVFASKEFVNLMRNKMNIHEDQIHNLERMNNDLHTRVQNLEQQLSVLHLEQQKMLIYSNPDVTATNRSSSLYPSTGNRDYLPSVAGRAPVISSFTPSKQSNLFSSYPRSYPRSFSTSPAAKSLSFQRPRVDYSYYYPESESTTAMAVPKSAVSPGVQFVAELSQLIEIDPFHQAPLSHIMDSYFAHEAANMLSPTRFRGH